MKILLAALMCLVLSSAECFALKGGPPYPGTTKSIVGTYAGVLTMPFCPRPNPAECGGVNALGIFTLQILQTGISNGVVGLFVEGRAFTGTMTAVANPNTTVLRGVVQTTSPTVVVLCNAIGSPVSGTVTDRADGQINANIRRTSRASLSIAGTLVIGTASLNATKTIPNPANCQTVTVTNIPLSLLVDGFKQSSS